MTGAELLLLFLACLFIEEAYRVISNYIYDCMVYVFGGATREQLAMEMQRRIDAILPEEPIQGAQQEMRQAQLRLAEEAEEQRLARWRLRKKNDTLRELQDVEGLRCVQNHPLILQQTITTQTVAKPLVGPFLEQDSGETEEEARIRRAEEKMTNLREFNMEHNIHA
jgi:hypothetical protein